MQVSFHRTAHCVFSRQHHIFVSGVIQTDSRRVPIGLVGLEALITYQIVYELQARPRSLSALHLNKQGTRQENQSAHRICRHFDFPDFHFSLPVIRAPAPSHACSLTPHLKKQKKRAPCLHVQFVVPQEIHSQQHRIL